MKITVNKNAKTVPTNFFWQFGVGNDMPSSCTERMFATM